MIIKRKLPAKRRVTHKRTSATTGLSTFTFLFVFEFKLLIIGDGNCMIIFAWHLDFVHSQVAEMIPCVGEPLPEVETRSAH